MVNRIVSRVALLLSLCTFMAAAPVVAQGKGNGNGNGNGGAARAAEQQRPQLQRRDAEDDRYEEEEGWFDPSGVWNEGRRRNVPPGWCQGRGNPHNTVENCGYNASNRPATGGRGGSYAQQHAEFHRSLDQKYSALAAQRPLDLRYQIELRSRKSAEHQRWHTQTGTRHE